MYCEEGQCEFNGLMEALKAKEAENARLRAAMNEISVMVGYELESAPSVARVALSADQQTMRQEK